MDKKKTDIPKDTSLQHCGKIRPQCQGKWSTWIHSIGSTIAREVDQTKLCVSNAK